MIWRKPVILLACVALCAAADAPEARDDAGKLKGLWAMTSVTVLGVRQPDDPTAGTLITAFDGESYLRKRGSEILEEGRYKIDPGKTPRVVDFVITKGQDAGKRMLGIYELEGDTLKICVARAGDKKRPKRFDGGAGAGTTVVVSRRYKP